MLPDLGIGRTPTATPPSKDHLRRSRETPAQRAKRLKQQAAKMRAKRLKVDVQRATQYKPDEMRKGLALHVAEWGGDAKDPAARRAESGIEYIHAHAVAVLNDARATRAEKRRALDDLRWAVEVRSPKREKGGAGEVLSEAMAALIDRWDRVRGDVVPALPAGAPATERVEVAEVVPVRDGAEAGAPAGTAGLELLEPEPVAAGAGADAGITASGGSHT